jgi:hypothetical protein
MLTDFRIDILRNYIKVGEIFAESVNIHFDRSSEVMKGIRMHLHKVKMSNDSLSFDYFKDRIQPVLIHDGIEKPLGVFMVMANPKTMSDVLDYVSIEGYDETMILKQAAFENRQYYSAGTTFLSIIESILTTHGISNVYKIDSTATLSQDLEFAVGDNCLTAINALLDAINYQHLWQDATGRFYLMPVMSPTEADFKYTDRKHDGFLLDNIEEGTDIYNLPNVVIGVWSSPDADDPIVYKKVNDDPMSVISTISRGYRVVKRVDLRNIASETELKDYVDRVAFEATQATETVSFTTIIEANHEPNTAVQLDTEDIAGLFIETGWDMTISTSKYSMRHTAERKVFV